MVRNLRSSNPHHRPHQSFRKPKSRPPRQLKSSQRLMPRNFKQMCTDMMNSTRSISINAELLRGRHYIVGYIPEKKFFIFVHRETGLMVAIKNDELGQFTYKNTTVSNLLLQSNVLLLEVKISRIHTVVNPRGDFVSSTNKINILKTVECQELRNKPIHIINNGIMGPKIVFSDNSNKWCKSSFIAKKLIQKYVAHWDIISPGKLILFGCCMDKLNSVELPSIYLLDIDQNIVACRTMNYFSQILDTPIHNNMSFLEALVRDDTMVEAYWDRNNIKLKVVTIPETIKNGKLTTNQTPRTHSTKSAQKYAIRAYSEQRVVQTRE